MRGLTTLTLGQACRIFMTLAYPEGISTVPPAKRLFWDIAPEQPLESLLVPPTCQPLLSPDGGTRGCVLRLGSKQFPHVKVQIVLHSDDQCVFGVDTHDAVRVAPEHPDAPRWAELQAANRRLKEQVESAWQQAGLLTFHGLLRQGLERTT